MAKSGSFYLDASSQETTYWTYMQGWVGWTESNVSAENNTSKVTVELQCHKSSGSSKTTGTWSYSIYINGSCVAASTWYGSIGSDFVTVATASATVPHNADGSKTVSIYASISGPGGTTMSGKTSSATGYAALTSIPRASTIGATDANIGSTSVIAVTKMTSGYTHTIAYAFGTLSGYLNAAGAMVDAAEKMETTSLSMTVPTAWYAQIPAAKSAVCTLTCVTYSGDTQIGDAKTTTFTVTASEALCTPLVTGAVADINTTTIALTGDAQRLIRYASTAQLTIEAQARNSASIVEKRIAGQAVSDDVQTVAEVDASSFSFAATDSRGYIGQATVEPDVVAYVRLTNNAVAKRTDATSGKAALSLQGTYYNGSFGAANNALTAKYRAKTKGGTYGAYNTLAPTISGSGYSLSTEIAGLDYNSEWVVEVTVSDKLMSKTVEVAIGKGIPIANWGEDFWQFNVPMRMADESGDSYDLTPALVKKLSETLPIESGGTGATDAAAALANLGGVSITKLWENESPTSSFAAQTIELDLSEYQLILLYARISTDYESLNSASAVVGEYSRINGVWGNNNNVFHRAFTPSATGIKFEGGYYNGAYNTSYLIPRYIYGIKGVT